MRTLLLLVLPILAGLLQPVTAAAGEGRPTVTIALVDTFSPDFYINVYSPTIDHLIEALPDLKLRMVEIDWRDVEGGIRHEKPDFLVVSGSAFVSLLDSAGAHQVATREPRTSADVSRTVASTLIVRRGDGANSLSELKGRTVAVSDRTSFDGWLIAQGELAREGWDPDHFFREVLETEYGIPDVAALVKLGVADAGVLSTCEYERLLADGLINRRDFRILNERPADGGCVRSTERYPDVVFASLPSASSDVVRAVTVALLSMPEKNHVFRWTVCNDFRQTFDLLRTLKTGPFAHLRDMSPAALWARWRTEILLGLGLVLAVLFHIVSINLLVRRRTEELSESLQQTKRFYDEAQDARQKLLSLERTSIVAQLSSMFAHEIKQPLMNISLYAGALRMLLSKDGRCGGKAEGLLDAIGDEVKRSSDIVEHVRSYAKKQKRTPVLCDLSQIARDAVGLAQSAGVPIVLGDLPAAPILADPFEIQFVVLNFLKNALAAAAGVPDGRVWLCVEKTPDGCRLMVSDNGPRLSDEVFNRLGRTGASTKTDGLGFGLAIATAIAERNCGHLEFERIEPQGLRATLVLRTPAGLGNILQEEKHNAS